MQQLASYIDYTALRPFLEQQAFQTHLQEARHHAFASVCIPPYLVPQAAEYLAGTSVKVGTVVGFPLGYISLHEKLSELIRLIDDGADELDFVMNISAFKSQQYDYVRTEIQQLTTVAHQARRVVKCILETAYLDEDEVKRACDLCAEARVDFVKTSTGFAPEGAHIRTVYQMRRWLPDTVGVKASGGIRTYEQAMAFLEAGATRIGTSALLTEVHHEVE
ncbi:deoxyribose-phosphate aldolase [Catalinimonas alkaloidigena]|uniref:Deoxyribose-phosphate aldolase n=1 Tax=Catalinimonas alkaloidigena TaxID=1075417 RepID=A0A1G9DFG5_9BACT|nr:deoxyribose-phosphate aldolase [Catalinimonas alkaloidigena]SDK62616.1 deoxyribose-phosphate aldolase [Catalinimonas alkaloidigena]